MDIKNIATALSERYETRDPFEIADNLGYCTIYAPLIEVRGFYQYIEQCHIICIDSALNKRQARFVCAHELGHSLLHRGINRIFMDAHTRMVASRYEKEADQFAVDLLFDDSDLQSYLDWPILTVAECLGISRELAEYRMVSVGPRLVW